MSDLKMYESNAHSDWYAISAPRTVEKNPGCYGTAIDVIKSEDKETEFCDCFFCNIELSDEQKLNALKAEDLIA